MQIAFALSIQDKSFAITCIFDLYYIAKPADAGFGLSTSCPQTSKETTYR